MPNGRPQPQLFDFPVPGFQPSITPAIESTPTSAAQTALASDVGTRVPLTAAQIAEYDSAFGGPANVLEIAPSNVLEIPSVVSTATTAVDTGAAGAEVAGTTVDLTATGAASVSEAIPIIGIAIAIITRVVEIAMNPSHWNPLDKNSGWYQIPVPGIPQTGQGQEIARDVIFPFPVGLTDAFNALKDAFSGVPKLQKSQAVASSLGGVENRALQGYYAAVERALANHVPLSVSSGYWRAYLDHAAGQAIRGLVSQGYPPQLAAQLFKQLIDGKIHQIPPSFGFWLLRHPHYKGGHDGRSIQRAKSAATIRPRPRRESRSVLHNYKYR